MSDVQISAPAGSLQVRAVWQESAQVALICHPHPLFGGTMDNKVVTTLMRFFKNQTQTQTAQALSMTQVQVSRREKKILLLLREKLAV